MWVLAFLRLAGLVTAGEVISRACPFVYSVSARTLQNRLVSLYPGREVPFLLLELKHRKAR